MPGRPTLRRSATSSAVMTAEPEVTVVIPTRDRWTRLEGTLRGALLQGGVALEVIVVDDGSVDETPARLAAVKDPRLRVIRQPASRGVSAARNAAIALARGEWVAFLDDDDLWAPEKLQELLIAARRARATWAYSGAVVLDERLSLLDEYTAPPADDIVEALLAYSAIPAGASNVVARADAIRAVGGYDEALSVLADWDLWIRLALSGPAAACEAPLIAYIQHPGGMVVMDSSGLIDEFERLEEKYREAGDQHGIRLDRMGLVRWIAWGYGRGGRRARAASRYLQAAGMYARRGKLWATGANIRDSIGALLGEDVTDSGRRPLYLSGATPPTWVELYR
jgi:glycosyltransferase involved in cell wall biosynthesis